jgi:hypothetical protein
MEQDWSPEVVSALEALGKLGTVWFVSTIGFDIAEPEGQNGRLYRQDGQWYVELSNWKKTVALSELFADCDVAVVVVGGHKRVHGYNAALDNYREIGPNHSAHYSDEQKRLIQRELSAPRTGDSEKLARVKGMIEALSQGDRAILRPWIQGRFEEDGSKHIDRSESQP